MAGKVVNDTKLTIATTPTLISDHVFNGKRASIILRNTSTAGEVISIAMIGEAKAGEGIVLNQGDVYGATKDAGYEPSRERITAVASAATAVLSIHEEIELD